MKVNIEIDLTPEEFHDLFVPSEKQQEFVRLLVRAYLDAAMKSGGELFEKSTEEIYKMMKWS